MITLLIVLVVIGIVINFIPMEPRVRSIVVAVVGVAAVVILIQMLTGHHVDIN